MIMPIAEQHFRLLVENVRDYAIFLLDVAGNVSTWNAGAKLIKGYDADEIIGRHFSVFYPREAVASGWPGQELELALADGRMQDEGWRMRKDGSRFWASVTITALYEADGTHIGFAKITRDLTDQRRVQVLEDEGRRMLTFLATLGHELRNPLAPIANAVSVMKLERLESQNLLRCRDILDRQVVQLTRLVDDLLDVGRITSGKIRLSTTRVDLARVLAEAVEMAEPEARQRDHMLHLDMVPGSTWIHGDRSRLLQVFSNLLNNAVKFTPNGGAIKITLRRDGANAEVSVRDNGPGIPPHRLDDIFNLFVQGDAEVDSVAAGLGLGLGLVQQLVALHGGQTSVFSAGIAGKGAEFVVCLPLDAASEDPGAATDGAHAGSGQSAASR